MNQKDLVTKSVIDSIKRIVNAMGGDGADVNEKTRLFEDLGFVAAFRRELARPLSKISQKNGGKRISKAEAGTLKTVKAAITLVMKRINAEAK